MIYALVFTKKRPWIKIIKGTNWVYAYSIRAGLDAIVGAANVEMQNRNFNEAAARAQAISQAILNPAPSTPEAIAPSEPQPAPSQSDAPASHSETQSAQSDAPKSGQSEEPGQT